MAGLTTKDYVKHHCREEHAGELADRADGSLCRPECECYQVRTEGCVLSLGEPPGP